MSCRNIETTIIELARGQMVEARVKEDALSHMQACKPCAARFTDEQTLTSGLRAVAAIATTIETPARIEAALLSAFRQGATSSPFVLDNAPTRPLATPWLPWSIAAAAAILILSVFALPRLLSDSSPKLAEKGASDERLIHRSSPAIKTSDPTSAHDNSGIKSSENVENIEQQSRGVSPMPLQADRRRPLVQTASLRNRSVRGSDNIQPDINSNEEITTEFLPLTYGSNLSQLDDGQVVRVELPRSALQSFGLSVNAERASERVKADVLLGHDGVARAIRFVR